MPTSFCHLAAHIIFTTKGRRQLIKNSMKSKLYSYIAGIIKRLKGKPIIINGTNDHIHILCLLPKDESPSKLVQNIKTGSSKWILDTYDKLFAWQKGYAMFSVSKSISDSVIDYIANQEEHHKKVSFSIEIQQYLKLHGIDNGKDNF